MDNQTPSRHKISLKDIPPLDPSKIPPTPTPKPKPPSSKKLRYPPQKTRWVAVRVKAQGKTSQMPKQIDPNGTHNSHELGSNVRVYPANNSSISEPQGDISNVPARAQLNDICTANHWNSPVYLPCKEEGPSHLMYFSYKVVVKIKLRNIILESYGLPQPNKKAAQDSAAEGAVWYLKSLDYSPFKKVYKGSNNNLV